MADAKSTQPLVPLTWPMSWAYAHGEPQTVAQLKTHCSDFLVTEDLGFEPCGEGEHVYLDITKTDTNTDFLARNIAKLAGVPARQVNYSGLKDRRGVTRQWFGVHLPGKAEDVDPDWEQLQSPQVHLHQAVRHLRKLKTGVHQGNYFCIRLRGIGASEGVERRLATIAQQGAPNYFGDQRFGHHGGNLGLALSMLQGKRIKDRFKRGMALSSVRSYLFNQLLSERVKDSSWLQAIAGDRCMFSDGFSQFDAAADGADLVGVQDRIDVSDLAPTGPMAGRVGHPPVTPASLYENQILAPFSPWIEALVAQDLTAQRRSLRLWPKDFSWHWVDDDVLELKFHLMRGSYATALIREITQTQ
ncbi:MAG: tRNA pseudouridine(13) synthase TruD [Oceanospirillaceae bacterium]|jgi:tRNA pseudouridine13 synthase|nr:tRNA pseudouridine(13) synthase TruD [Oceanospirillaceae bacterium]MBT7329700.1 tRNA pseudouridine(13) synthase TruD [Oceanospirillaceae bacterium]